MGENGAEHKTQDELAALKRYVDDLQRTLDEYAVSFSQRLLDIELSYNRLEARLKASTSAPPMDRGMTFFATGDPIPSHSATDLIDGKIWVFVDGKNDRPLRFTKNVEGRALKKGERIYAGVVDSELRQPEVGANNFFWLEI
jgi:hypothetical protein